ncbi:MAG: prephenate dehydrogenase [Gemmatimonadota bacterium]|nr:prephenate dehydrogenase [Gemmatimonadota bacterium]
MREGVGIVGFGRCGHLAARLLSERGKVAVTDVRDRSLEAEAMGVTWADLDAVADRPVVLLAVPIRSLPSVLDELAPRLSPGALVVDLASVKIEPMRWMAERLPDGVERVGTHPLFGPDTAREHGIEGQWIAVTPAEGHESAADRVVAEARRLGLRPIVTTPEDHDRQMARSQALVFLVARAARSAGLGSAEYGTPSERRVGAALRMVEEDTDQLYEDIVQLNPYAADAAEALANALHAEISRLVE